MLSLRVSGILDSVASGRAGLAHPAANAFQALAVLAQSVVSSSVACMVAPLASESLQLSAESAFKYVALIDFPGTNAERC